MKSVFSILFVFLMFYNQSPAQTVGRSYSDGSGGPIRSLRIVNAFQTQVVLYDRKGNEIERTLYKTDEPAQRRIIKEFGADGEK